MDTSTNSALNVQVQGLSRDFLEQVWLMLKEEPGIHVTLVQDGVEALRRPLGGPPADVLILRKSTRSADFYDIVSDYVLQHPDVKVILSAPFKDPDMMVQALRAGVKEFLFEPFQEGEISAMVRRLGGQPALEKSQVRAKVLAFIPCKGGSGATFLSTNLAHVLASKLGKQVLLVDLNLQFGDAYLYLIDHAPLNTLGEVCGSFIRFDYRFLESAVVRLQSGLRLLAAPSKPADADLVRPEHIESIVSVARKHFDYVVLDLGRTLDAVTLKSLDLADAVFPVLQLSLPSIRDAQRMKAVFDSLDYSESKVRWLLNRADGEGDLAVNDVTSVIGKVFWSIPNDHKRVEESVNQGVPIVELHPRSPAAKSLVELAEAMLSDGDEKKTRKHWFSLSR